MYACLGCGTLLAAIGLALYSLRWLAGRSECGSLQPEPLAVVLLGLFYGCFCFGLAYQAELMFILFHVSTTQGWYLYCTIGVETLLTTIGLFALCPATWRRWVLPVSTALFAILDLYGVHFLLIPYYTGLISYGADGHLARFHIRMIQEVGWGALLHRLLINKPASLSEPIFVLLWVLFLISIVGLILISGQQASTHFDRQTPAESGAEIESAAQF